MGSGSSQRQQRSETKQLEAGSLDSLPRETKQKVLALAYLLGRLAARKALANDFADGANRTRTTENPRA